MEVSSFYYRLYQPADQSLFLMTKLTLLKQPFSNLQTSVNAPFVASY